MRIFDSKNKNFTLVYSDYYSLIFGIIFSKINSMDVADDLTQEVFLRYYQNMEKITDSKKIRPWLYGTLTFVLKEYYRERNKTGNKVDIDELEEDLAISYINGFQDTRIIVNQAIDNLKEEKDKIIFNLIAVQNYTYSQVESELGVPKRKVKYRYHLTIRFIIDYLKKKGISDLEELL